MVEHLFASGCVRDVWTRIFWFLSVGSSRFRDAGDHCRVEWIRCVRLTFFCMNSHFSLFVFRHHRFRFFLENFNFTEFVAHFLLWHFSAVSVIVVDTVAIVVFIVRTEQVLFASKFQQVMKTYNCFQTFSSCIRLCAILSFPSPSLALVKWLAFAIPFFSGAQVRSASRACTRCHWKRPAHHQRREEWTRKV